MNGLKEAPEHLKPQPSPPLPGIGNKRYAFINIFALMNYSKKRASFTIIHLLNNNIS